MNADFNFNDLAADMVENLGCNELEFSPKEFTMLCSICSNAKPEIDLKLYGAKIFTIGLLINKFPAFLESIKENGISPAEYKTLITFLWNNASYEINSYYSNLLMSKVNEDEISIYSPAQNKITVLGLSYSPELDKKFCSIKSISGVKYNNRNWLIDILDNSETEKTINEIKKIING